MMTKRRISLIALGIVLALFGVLFVGAYSNIAKYRFVILQTNEPLSFKALVAAALSYDATLTVFNSIAASFDDEKLQTTSQLRDLQISVPPNAFKHMASDLPDSAKAKYFTGEMLYPDGEWRKMKFRFRGRNIWHWSPEKPSLRIKLKKDNPIDLQRHINLVNPEDITMVANLYGEELAAKFGILSHKTEMVRLFVNDAYYGVYQMTTREDENMLRANKRIPGPIFVGDQLGKHWKPEQFEVSGDLDALEYVSPIEQLVSSIYKPADPTKYDALWSILDMEKTASWIAMLNLTGGKHTDYHHNHAYYFDPSIGKLEPLTSDILALGTALYPGPRDRLIKDHFPDHKLPINEQIHPLLDVALKDPRFYDLRNKRLYQAMESFGSVESQHTNLNELYKKIEPDVKADRRKAFVMSTFAGWFRMPYSNGQFDQAREDIFEWIELRDSWLRDKLSNTALNTTSAPDNMGGSWLLVSVNGNSSVNLDLSQFPDGSVSGKIPFSEKMIPLLGSKVTLYPGLREDDSYFYDLTDDRRVPKYYLFPDTQSYLIHFNQTSVPDLQEKISSIWSNGVTGEVIVPTHRVNDRINVDRINYNSVSQHIWTFPKPNTDDIILGPGLVKINNDLISNPGQVIRILAGTTLEMGPGISIVSQGPLRIEGERESPIKILRQNPDQAWGVIAAHGRETSGSYIRYADISGGSRSTILNVQYSGMVTFRWSENVSVEHSSIHNNIVGDDTLHLVHSTGELSNLTLSDCFGDCADLDYSDASLSNITVQNAGNDALDFMTSIASITKSHLAEVGDKGVSGGEASFIEITSVQIENAITGVAAKDDSYLNLNNVKFFNNQIAIDAFHKNWRYDKAGSVEVFNSMWKDNIVDIRALDGGQVTITGGVGAETLIEDQGKITVNAGP